MGEIYSRAALVLAHTGNCQQKLKDDRGEPPSSSHQENVGTNQIIGIRDTRLDDASSAHDDEKEPLTASGPHSYQEHVSVAKTSQAAISLMNYLTRLWESDDDYSLKQETECRYWGLSVPLFPTVMELCCPRKERCLRRELGKFSWKTMNPAKR